MVTRLRLLIVVLLVGLVVASSLTASWWLRSGGLHERLERGVIRSGLDLRIAAERIAYVPGAVDVWFASGLALTASDGTPLGAADSMTIGGSLEQPTALTIAGFEAEAGLWAWFLQGGAPSDESQPTGLNINGTIPTRAGRQPLRLSISADDNARRAAVGAAPLTTSLRQWADGLLCEGSAVPADLHHAALAHALPALAQRVPAQLLPDTQTLSLLVPADPKEGGIWRWSHDGVAVAWTLDPGAQTLSLKQTTWPGLIAAEDGGWRVLDLGMAIADITWRGQDPDVLHVTGPLGELPLGWRISEGGLRWKAQGIQRPWPASWPQLATTIDVTPRELTLSGHGHATPVGIDGSWTLAHAAGSASFTHATGSGMPRWRLQDRRLGNATGDWLVTDEGLHLHWDDWQPGKAIGELIPIADLSAFATGSGTLRWSPAAPLEIESAGIGLTRDADAWSLRGDPVDAAVVAPLFRRFSATVDAGSMRKVRVRLGDDGRLSATAHQLPGIQRGAVVLPAVARLHVIRAGALRVALTGAGPWRDLVWYVDNDDHILEGTATALAPAAATLGLSVPWSGGGAFSARGGAAGDWHFDRWRLDGSDWGLVDLVAEGIGRWTARHDTPTLTLTGRCIAGHWQAGFAQPLPLAGTRMQAEVVLGPSGPQCRRWEIHHDAAPRHHLVLEDAGTARGSIGEVGSGSASMTITAERHWLHDLLPSLSPDEAEEEQAADTGTATVYLQGVHTAGDWAWAPATVDAGHRESTDFEEADSP